MGEGHPYSFEARLGHPDDTVVGGGTDWLTGKDPSVSLRSLLPPQWNSAFCPVS